MQAGAQVNPQTRAGAAGMSWWSDTVSHVRFGSRVAFAALQDIESGFGYLGDLDTALLYGWLRKPYSL